MLLPSSGSVSLILPGSFLSYSGPNSSLSEYFSGKIANYVGSVLPSSFQLNLRAARPCRSRILKLEFLVCRRFHLLPGKINTQLDPADMA